MTTTAHEDQFTVGTQTIEKTVRQPYDTVAILRRNIADMELALKQQAERAEAAEAELAKLREQKPVAWRHENGNIFLPWQKDLIVTGAVFSPLYAAPVPAPHPGATHCGDCGLTWLDDGLNPLGCPYCKDPVHAAAVLDEPLLCDTCGAQCDDPWHYSKDNQRHLHACDDCYESCITVNERNARRYLALRKHGILLRQEAVVFDVTDLDAAADRLLEGGE